MKQFDFNPLTPAERLDLIAELWDSLSSKDIPLTSEQDAELARRLTTFEQDISKALPWDAVEGRVLARRH